MNPAELDAIRTRMNATLDTFDVETFRRLHSKFFAAIMALEVGFKRRFPAEWAAHEKEFYGDDVQGGGDTAAEGLDTSAAQQARQGHPHQHDEGT